MLTLILSLVVTGINQSIKLIMRYLGATKEMATDIVLLFGFTLSVLFTILQNYGFFSTEQILSVITIFTASIGNYELFLKKIGIDSYLKGLVDNE